MNEMSKDSDDEIPEETPKSKYELAEEINWRGAQWHIIEDAQEGKEWLEETNRLKKELYELSTEEDKATVLELTFKKYRKGYKKFNKKNGIVTIDQIMIDIWGFIPEYESLSDEEKAVVDRIKNKNRWIK